MLIKILKWFSNKDLLYTRRLITEILANRLSHHEQSKLFWDNNGYIRNLYISPHNPSKDDIKIYKKYLTEGKNNKRVLLLGSTPLLRHLLSELGYRDYVIADFSFTTIESGLRTLNKLGIDIDPENEIWLKSEWLEMPLEPEFFDYIVGDLVFTQIESNKQSLIVEKLASLLRKSGNFIGRMQMCNTNFDNKNPQVIIEEIINSNDFENTTEQRFALLFRLKDRLRDKKTHTTSLHAITNELLQFKTSDEKKLDFLRSIVKMISKRAEVGLPFITQTKGELEKLLSKEFSIEKRLNACDYPSEYFPIYVLQKINKSKL